MTIATSRAIRVSGTLVCAMAVLAQSAAAQMGDPNADVDSPGLAIQVSAGWDGTVDQSAPVPISFLLQNNSRQAVQGELILRDPWRGHTASLGEVFVSPSTSKRFASIRGMTEWDHCVAELRQKSKVLWRRELPIATGMVFSSQFNYVLFVHPVRRLQLPGISADSVVNNGESVIAAEEGKPLQSLTVKPWQIPDHAGPLVVAQAIVFAEATDVAILNRLQWQAVADWMCQGGTVFVHAESREIVDRLLGLSPLGAAEPLEIGDFTMRRSGLGALYEYPQPLLAANGTEVQRRIGAIASTLQSGGRFPFSPANYYSETGSQSGVNRMLLIFFFVGYALISGVGGFLQFRAGQRRVAVCTIAVVAGASVLAAMLGGYLRFSNGDLRWMTVTHAGAGGAVQFGRITVQSAGGRGRNVAVLGNRPDLQCLEERTRYYNPWNMPQQNEQSSYTWQPSLAGAAAGVYQVNVPITPWGERRLQAVDFNRNLKRMDFTLRFERAEVVVPADDGDLMPDGVPGGFQIRSGQMSPFLKGEASVKLVNRLPYDLIECSLIIGVTHDSDQTGGPLDVYYEQPLGAVDAGATLERSFQADFRYYQNEWERQRSWPGGWMLTPKLQRLGAATAWIIGRIDQSSALAVDEERSNFLPREELHLFVQEILPEDMPDAEVFRSRTRPADSPGPADGADESDTPPMN